MATGFVFVAILTEIRTEGKPFLKDQGMELMRTPSTKEKALTINLDRNIYGSFAEIGAGQETASHFFKVGGASGTIAKTMSAYDMKFSDAIYGKTKRYVSEEKLLKMLDHEIELLLERLPDRADTTKFFAFANTVEILNYHKTNQGHGWLGLRFQLFARAPMNECVLHVILHDSDASWQQQALGMLGVNLIYGCIHISHPEAMLQSLMDNLTSSRLEIDFFRLKGPDFNQVDNRLMALKLVKMGHTRATMFEADGTVLQPEAALYKKNVLLLRGRFRPVTHVTMDMLETGLEAFKKEEEVDENNIVLISELTLHALSGEEGISDIDFLHRVDMLGSLGQKVLISDYQKYFKLSSYISQITKGKTGIILGIFGLEKLFEESYYEELKGGILESMGLLFKRNVKLYVYPSHKPNSQQMYSCHDLVLPGPINKLYEYLYESQHIVGLQPKNLQHLNIYSDEVLHMIKNGIKGWEAMVPEKVARAIQSKKLFGYQQV